MAVLWIVNTDKDLNIETFVFKQSCFYLSFSVYFDGGSVLIFMFAASEWKLFVREVSSQIRSMPPNDPPGICLNC